ncbi:MAG: hypothetical protein HQK85_10315 [Nitrospinae bacterium]|nr:hypothetical protein [Nitrospinota bacterium]
MERVRLSHPLHDDPIESIVFVDKADYRAYVKWRISFVKTESAYHWALLLLRDAHGKVTG